VIPIRDHLSPSIGNIGSEPTCPASNLEQLALDLVAGLKMPEPRKTGDGQARGDLKPRRLRMRNALGTAEAPCGQRGGEPYRTDCILELVGRFGLVMPVLKPAGAACRAFIVSAVVEE